MSLFSTPSEIDIQFENDTDIRGTFIAGNTDYKVWARYNHLMSGTGLGENVWEMFFAMCYENEDDKIYGLHDIKPNGAGNAVRVFSTVIKFMEYIKEKHDSSDFVFSAKDKKQQRLYLKLIERYQKLGVINSVVTSEKGNIIKFEVV
jgi:hypothetical protein